MQEIIDLLECVIHNIVGNSKIWKEKASLPIVFQVLLAIDLLKQQTNDRG